jgi:hypothetical protein
MPAAKRPAAEIPAAKVKSPPAYDPDREAYGYQLNTANEWELAPIDPSCGRLCEGWIDPGKVMTDGSSEVFCSLWEGTFDEKTGRLREARTTPMLSKDQIRQRYTNLRESTKLQESDWFAMGGNGGWGQPESPLTANYVPMIPGPATRQQYWADYWASSAKCYEAWNHSGIARRAVKAMVNFPLARGVQWKIEDDKAQQAWEEFWDTNELELEFRTVGQDLSIFGEQFLRYFAVKRGDKGYLLVRQLDPASIYEVVTDQEDLKTVYFYHQQFQTRMEMYSPPRANKAPEGATPSGVTRYIIRQIDAKEIDHYRINVVEGEARGRSDLFPVLADLKRLRDLLTSKVIQADIATRIMGVLQAKGTSGDINRVLNAIFPNGQAPAPGSFVGTNDQVELKALDLSPSAGIREDFTYEELVDQIVAGVGVSRANLGLSPATSSGTTQSTALTSETSGGKAFEERQLLLKKILNDMFNRVMDVAGVPLGDRRNHEFILPELAKEDRSAKLEDLGTAEGMGWISKQTAATSAAAELGLTQYDFDSEMELIIAEFDLAEDTDGKTEMGNDKPAQGGKIRRPMMLASKRQAPKLDPTKAQGVDDEPAGVLVGPGGAQIEGQKIAGAGSDTDDPAAAVPVAAGAKTSQKAAGGIPASKAPGTQKARESTVDTAVGDHIRRTPDDPEYQAHVDEFTAATGENLKQFLAELEPVG